MKALLVYFLLLLNIQIQAQIKPPDTAKGVFAEWQNIFQANKDLNYVGFGPWFINGQGEVPPLFEGQIRQPFLLLKGRDNQRPFMRSIAVNFMLGLNLRMYQGKGNESFPVRPLNFMTPGITVDYLLNQLFRSIKKVALEDSSNIKNYFNFQFYVTHYSNGQSGPFYNLDSSSTNHVDGNFSTNFYRPQFTWSYYTPKGALISTAFSWTHDFAVGELLGIEEGLKKSYGFDKLGFMYQIKTDNLNIGNYWYKKAAYEKEVTDTSKKITLVSRIARYKRYASFLFRIEAGYILGNLDNYPTMKNQRIGKNRESLRLTFGYYPANMRTLGLFTNLYVGRDYYNIRYTDKLVNIKLGFLFDIQKHSPPNTPIVSR